MGSEKDRKKLVKQLIGLLGNKDNIIEVTHCATRLRFILKDETLVDTAKIEGLSGVVKAFSSAGQFQVVIGAGVSEVCDALLEELQSTNEKKDGPSGKEGFHLALGKLSGYLAACMQPLIPVLVAAGMIRTLATLLGPSMLGWLDQGNGTLRILTAAGEAGFVSLPVFIAWSASDYLKTNTALALFYGVFLISPGLGALINGGEAATLFGLKVPSANYSSQVVPMMLIMIAMYLVEKILKRLLSEDAQFIGMMILETIIMLPLMLCFIGPLGTVLGSYISLASLALYRFSGALSVALIGAFFVFICATGMHTAIIATSFILIEKQGYDSLALVGAGAAAYACFGIYLAYAIFEKDRRMKRIGLSALMTHAIGGVAEPGMFSLLFASGHLMRIQIVSAFFGSLYLGIRKVGMYVPGVSNFMAVLQYAGGGSDNLLHATIGCGISFLTAFALTAVMQIRKDQLS